MTQARVSDNKKKIGRPSTGVGKLIGLRWHDPELTAIDAWRANQPDLPSRPEAIRRLVEHGLVNASTSHRKGPPAPPTPQLTEADSPSQIKGRRSKRKALPGG